MMDDKKSKALTIILVVIIVVIVGVLSYLGYVALKDKKVEDTYTQAANEFEKKVAGSPEKSKGSNSTLNSVNVSLDKSDRQQMEGYNVIGTIEIPKVDLKCAILEEVTPRSIEIAVGMMYTTAGLNEPGNTVIYGHNYRNKLFFSRNDELQTGDEIRILDESGRKITYEIFNIFETTMTDTTFYTRTAEITNGKVEVTLSTCTDDASETDRRLIIQAREK
ncbi:MAG: sortase [Clostridia bacterium]|jgi:LPXTG-site transpeptidase (sortase) family protein|nr:sortase [Clostridia bacterium]